MCALMRWTSASTSSHSPAAASAAGRSFISRQKKRASKWRRACCTARWCSSWEETRSRPPLLGFIAFGAARVVAPVTLIGVVFHEPLAFAVFSTVIGLVGSALLFVEPIELRVAQVIVPSQPPTPEEEE